MEQIESSGHIKGYFVTVDAAAPGKREADERSRAEVEVVSIFFFFPGDPRFFSRMLTFYLFSSDL